MAAIEREIFIETPLVELSSEETALIGDLSDIVSGLNTRAIIKGGFVRDKICNSVRGTNIQPNDLDILIAGNIHNVVTAAQKKGMEVIERRARKKTPVFKLQSPHSRYEIEIGVVRANPFTYDNRPSFVQLVHEEALSSELGVNALSMELVRGTARVYDLFDAVNQLKRGVLSLSNPQCFFTNPETPLRVIRIVNKTGCTLDDEAKRHLREANYVVTKMQPWFARLQIVRLLQVEKTREDNWQMMLEYGYADLLVPKLSGMTATEAYQSLTK